MNTLNRREWLRMSAAGLAGTSVSGWFDSWARAAAVAPARRRSCILLWMSGGPSQMDTFDLKPGHANGGPYRPISTSVPGIQISEHLPKLSARIEHLALVRSMSTKEGDHRRGTFKLHTGHLPQGPIHYPTLGSLLSKELGTGDAPLPNFVSIGPYRFVSPAAFGPGFLGPEYSPLVVGDGQQGPQAPGQTDYARALRVRNLDLPGGVDLAQADARLEILDGLNADFLAGRPDLPAQSHRTAYRKAVRMMRSAAVEAFGFDDEPGQLRDAYGRNRFGQGCLLARRLVERGVPFVEVSLNSIAATGVFGWDTHRDNFESVKQLSAVLDAGWATLLDDLERRGLLDSTMIVWMGEFGRTPKINGGQGRDHFPNAWSTVLSGGGIKGGSVVGKTSRSGTEVVERPVSVPDLLATVCNGLGIDPLKQNMSNVGRPIRIVDPGAEAIDEIVA